MSADKRDRQTPDDSHDDQQPAAGSDARPAGRDGDRMRRAIVQAGWTLPVILAVKLPTDAFAQYAHGDTHFDVHVDGGQIHIDAPFHVDIPHIDLSR